MLRAAVVKQRVATARIGDEEIGPTIPVEVAEQRVARVAVSGESECGRRVGESAVEIIAVQRALLRADEQQIEVTVVIEVGEERLPCTMNVAHTSLFGQLDKCPVATVAEQVPASVAAYREEVEPAVVVVVGERGICRTLGKRDPGVRSDITNDSALHSVEVRDRSRRCGRPGGDEQRASACPVDLARGNRARCDDLARRWRSGGLRRYGVETRVVRGIDEFRNIGCRRSACAMQRNKVSGRKAEQQPPRDGRFCHPHLLEGCLIGRRTLHEMDEAIKRGPRLRAHPFLKQRDCAVQIDLRFGGGLWRRAPDLLQMTHDAVRFAEACQRRQQFESHREICRRNAKHITQALNVPPLSRTVGRLRLKLGEPEQHVRIAGVLGAERLQHGPRVRRPASERIELGQQDAHAGARWIELPGA